MEQGSDSASSKAGDGCGKCRIGRQVGLASRDGASAEGAQNEKEKREENRTKWRRGEERWKWEEDEVGGWYRRGSVEEEKLSRGVYSV